MLLGTLLSLAGCGAARQADPAGLRSAGPTTVLVVRHAERASDVETDPRLSEAGHARARALAEALADAGVDVVITSQYLRTRETALPLAERLGLGIVVDSVRSAEASSGELARRVLAEHAGRRVLIVGHSNTVPLIVRALGGAEVGPLTESAYGDLFIVILTRGRQAATIRGRFGAPD